jgi:hypothetical protein
MAWWLNGTATRRLCAGRLRGSNPAHATNNTSHQLSYVLAFHSNWLYCGRLQLGHFNMALRLLRRGRTPAAPVARFDSASAHNEYQINGGDMRNESDYCHLVKHHCKQHGWLGDLDGSQEYCKASQHFIHWFERCPVPSQIQVPDDITEEVLDAVVNKPTD